jgi:hypothetical protein
MGGELLAGSFHGPNMHHSIAGILLSLQSFLIQDTAGMSMKALYWYPEI